MAHKAHSIVFLYWYTSQMERSGMFSVLSPSWKVLDSINEPLGANGQTSAGSCLFRDYCCGSALCPTQQPKGKEMKVLLQCSVVKKRGDILF